MAVNPAAMSEEQRSRFLDDSFKRLMADVLFGRKSAEDKLSTVGDYGVFPTDVQLTNESFVMRPDRDCPMPIGEGFKNRTFFRILARSVINSLPDPISARDPQEAAWNRRKYVLRDNSSYPLCLNTRDHFNQFNISDLGAIVEIGQRYYKDENLSRFADRRIWGLVDVQALIGVGKARSAQRNQRGAFNNGEEFKDKNDLSPVGAWKPTWAKVVEDIKGSQWGILQTLLHNISKIEAVRDAQFNSSTPAGQEAYKKELDSARKSLRRLIPERDLFKHNTFVFADQHYDLDEFARCSPNYDERIGWVAIPQSAHKDLEKEAHKRVDRLVGDARVSELATRHQRSNREIAELVVLGFRSFSLAERLANAWETNLVDTWVSLLDGQNLLGLIVAPANSRQSLWMLGRNAERFVRWTSGAEIPLHQNITKFTPTSSTVIVLFGVILVVGSLFYIPLPVLGQASDALGKNWPFVGAVVVAGIFATYYSVHVDRIDNGPSFGYLLRWLVPAIIVLALGLFLFSVEQAALQSHNAAILDNTPGDDMFHGKP